MKTKSLVTLEAELRKLWAANSVGVLDRNERGAFYLNEPVSGIFSAREGFVTPSTRRVGTKSLLIVVGLVVGSVFAVYLALQATPNTQVAKPPTDSAASAPATPECLVNWGSLSPMEEDSVRFGSTELTLMRDIVIGGVREQTIATRCAGSRKNFDVTFVKQGAAWKVKGAIPAESHP